VFTKMKIGAARLFVVCSSVAFGITACKPAADSTQDTSQVAQSAQASNPDSSILLRGSVVSVSAKPGRAQIRYWHRYGGDRAAFPGLYSGASDLSKVQEKTFIGVTTVKQPDGSERATEIHIFPEELRGPWRRESHDGTGDRSGREQNDETAMCRRRG